MISKRISMLDTLGVRSRDTLLSVATSQEFAQYFAQRVKLNKDRVWTGEFRAQMNTLDARTVNQMFTDLAAYVSERSSSDNKADHGPHHSNDAELTSIAGVAG